MIELKINNALKSLCDGRVSPLTAEFGTKPPYICYTKVSGSYDDVMCGRSVATYCFQIDVYATTLLEAEVIKDQAYECLKQLKPFDTDEKQKYEADTGLYRSTLEFYIQ